MKRLFTALTSERGLEKEKMVSQLTIIIHGKKLCCRKDRADDWKEVREELRKLWEVNPRLFEERFNVDIILHVDR